MSGGSSSSVSLEKEKRSSSPLEREKQNIAKEGHLHCKITDIDGKVSPVKSILLTVFHYRVCMFYYSDQPIDLGNKFGLF